MVPTDRAGDPDEQLDPLDGLAIIDAQRAHVHQATDVDGRVLFGAWGVAWLAGYLALWFTIDPDAEIAEPSGLGFIVFAALLVSAIVVTIAHMAQRFAGLRGESTRIGQMLGIAWGVASVTVVLLNAAFARTSIADTELGGVIANTLPCLVVGVLYMGMGAMSNEPRLLALGAWICLVTAAAALVGVPGLFLVMALAGGGGFLVAAAVETVLCWRRA